MLASFLISGLCPYNVRSGFRAKILKNMYLRGTVYTSFSRFTIIGW